MYLSKITRIMFFTGLHACAALMGLSGWALVDRYLVGLGDWEPSRLLDIPPLGPRGCLAALETPGWEPSAREDIPPGIYESQFHSGLEMSRSYGSDGNCPHRVKEIFSKHENPPNWRTSHLGWSNNSGGWSGASEISVPGWNLLFASVKCPGALESCVGNIWECRYRSSEVCSRSSMRWETRRWWQGSFDLSSFISLFIPAMVRSPNTSMIAPLGSLRKCL